MRAFLCCCSAISLGIGIHKQLQKSNILLLISNLQYVQEYLTKIYSLTPDGHKPTCSQRKKAIGCFSLFLNPLEWVPNCLVTKGEIKSQDFIWMICSSCSSERNHLKLTQCCMLIIFYLLFTSGIVLSS